MITNLIKISTFFAWLLASHNIFIFSLSSLFIYMIFIKKEIIIKKPIFGKVKIPTMGVDYSIAPFLLIIKAFNGLQTNNRSYFHGKSHTIYEHSIGHSFSNSLISTPSFYGKDVKWHFLSSQVSRMFEAFGIEFIR